MKIDDERIDAIEDRLNDHPNEEEYADAGIRALCEIARQLARIADTLEFAEGLDEDDDEEEDDEIPTVETAEP